MHVTPLRVLLQVMMFAALIAACLFWQSSLARAQDVHHHVGQSAAVDKFYSTWFMPDNPSKSCCNVQDCYPTQAKFEHGQWWALRREDEKYIPVPWSKVEVNRDNPDGRTHLCAPEPESLNHPPDTVFCFSLGGGT
jgi:hypothetical protein